MALSICSSLSIRLVGLIVVIAVCLLAFLSTNYEYIPVHTVTYGEQQIEAPKLEIIPTKKSSKAFKILEPTAPLDRFDIALPSNLPPEPLVRPDVPLVTYVYVESGYARINLKFFVDHGLHAAADFIFILNGDTDADALIPRDRPNVKVIRRKNTCYDLGSHWEILIARKRGGKALRDTYKRFIMMNASIRGPFVPHWSRECWTDAYLNKLNDKVKLVGSAINCRDGTNNQHAMSMIWATDTIGLNLILTPAGIGQCFPTLEETILAEIRTTPLLKSAGYHVDVMMAMFQSEPNYGFENCTFDGDMLKENGYAGFNVHPFELLFVKTNRGINPLMIESLSADKNHNLAHAREKVLSAASKGANIIVLPECFNSPYGCDYFPSYAETLLPTPPTKEQSPSFHALSAMAAEAKVYLVGGSVPELETETKKYYNTSLTFSPEGKLLATHRKVHLFDIDIPGKITFKESEVLSPGNDITIIDLPEYGKIAVAICYDIRFPELAMIAARKGCFALIYPGAFNTTTGPLHWKLQGQARAMDNQVYVALCSPARDMNASYHAWGHSLVCDPMAEVMVEAGEAEDTVFADLDNTKIVDTRRGIPITGQRRFDVYPDVSK
ncbi:hypothetical protein VTL71DRAFT_905 [Oculimacula yallundae]|uniref:CN hydrolase domain-containing protein n=1 Tax=Oculimacula yallundae TaxID=86028 RepID=A0ABR4D2B2_9HELO